MLRNPDHGRPVNPLKYHKIDTCSPIKKGDK